MVETMSLKARPYQEAATKSTIAEIERGGKSMLGVAFTGAGKTWMAHDLIMSRFHPSKHRVLFTADIADLVYQTKNAFTRYTPDLANNDFTIHSRPGVGMVMGKHEHPHARIVLGTPQTLSGAENKPDLSRLNEVLKYGPIDLLILDEAHRVINASNMRMVQHLREANPDLVVVGKTATPLRRDGRGLSNIFDRIVYNYPMTYGIKHGYICRVLDPLNIETGVSVDRFAGETLEDAVARAIDVGNWSEIVSQSYVEQGENRPGMWFMPSVEHSRKFCKYMQEHGFHIGHVDSTGVIMPDGSETKDRSALYRWYSEWHPGMKPRMLTNFRVLTTGVDFPHTAFIGLALGTDDPTALTQIIGRGVRLHPSKQDLLILDYQLKGIELVQANHLFGTEYGVPDAPGEEELEQETLALAEPVEIREAEKNEENFIDGSGVKVSIGKIRQLSNSAWYPEMYERVWSLGLNETMSLFILEPKWVTASSIQDGVRVGQDALDAKPDDPKVKAFYDALVNGYELFSNYTLWMVKESKCVSRWLCASPNIQDVFDYAAPIEQQYLDAVLAKKTAGWRKGSVSITQKQIDLLQRLKYPHGLPVTKGEAAQLITHVLSYRYVKAVVGNYRLNCGRFGDVQDPVPVVQPKARIELPPPPPSQKWKVDISMLEKT